MHELKTVTFTIIVVWKVIIVHELHNTVREKASLKHENTVVQYKAVNY